MIQIGRHSYTNTNEDHSIPFEKNFQFMHLYRKSLSEYIVLERNFGKYWKSIWIPTKSILVT